MRNKMWFSFQKKCESLTGLLLVVMIALIFTQVLTRYVFDYSISWSEELTRYLFVWMIFLSLNLTIRDNLPIRIDLIDQFLPKKAKRMIDIIVMILSMFTFIVFAYSAYMFMLRGVLSTSPALGLPLYIAYAAMPVGFILSIIATIHSLLDNYRGGQK